MSLLSKIEQLEQARKIKARIQLAEDAAAIERAENPEIAEEAKEIDKMCAEFGIA